MNKSTIEMFFSSTRLSNNRRTNFPVFRYLKINDNHETQYASIEFLINKKLGEFISF